MLKTSQTGKTCTKTSKKLNVLQVRRTQRNPHRRIIIELSKDRESIRRQQEISNGTPTRNLSETVSRFPVRNPRADTFKVLEEKSYQPGILGPAKLSFKSEGEIKTYPDKKKLREVITTRPALEEMPQGALKVT